MSDVGVTPSGGLAVSSAYPSGGPSMDADGYAEKIFAAGLGYLETLSLYLGVRVGWWRALAASEGLTAAELATATRTDPRYALEWLEMQAVYDNLIADPSPDADRNGRRFRLPAGAREVLTDEHSLAYLGALPRLLASVGPQLDALATAYEHGGGVSWDQLGDGARSAQAALNRPWFETALAPALASVPELSALLQRPGAVLADIGCGGGWSSIALGRACPAARVLGIDPDAPSVEMARRHVAAAGLGDRVSVVVGAAEVELDLPADLREWTVAFAFECVHDLARPVEVLAAVRARMRPDGLLVVMARAVATSPASSSCAPDRRATANPGSAARSSTSIRPPSSRAAGRSWLSRTHSSTTLRSVTHRWVQSPRSRQCRSTPAKPAPARRRSPLRERADASETRLTPGQVALVELQRPRVRVRGQPPGRDRIDGQQSFAAGVQRPSRTVGQPARSAVAWSRSATAGCSRMSRSPARPGRVRRWPAPGGAGRRGCAPQPGAVPVVARARRSRPTSRPGRSDLPAARGQRAGAVRAGPARPARRSRRAAAGHRAPGRRLAVKPLAATPCAMLPSVLEENLSDTSCATDDPQRWPGHHLRWRCVGG